MSVSLDLIVGGQEVSIEVSIEKNVESLVFLSNRIVIKDFDCLIPC